MPIYLSLPGDSTKEPWRHGLLVYERPFPLPRSNISNNENDDHNNDNDNAATNRDGDNSAASGELLRHGTSTSVSSIHEAPKKTKTTSNNNKSSPTPIRRIRHAEVVLVDQCLIAHGRYWLRLKWPGEHGTHGGYVAMSKVADIHTQRSVSVSDNQDNQDVNSNTNNQGQGPPRQHDDTTSTHIESLNGQETAVISTSLLCTQTNICYPTSAAMKLLPSYDDGLLKNNNNNNNNSSGTSDGGGDHNDEILVSLETGEPVFCRICREGLHDVNTDYMETTGGPSQQQQQQQQQQSSLSNTATNAVGDDVDEGSRERDVVDTSAAAATTTTAAVTTTTTGTVNSTRRNYSEEERCTLVPILSSSEPGDSAEVQNNNNNNNTTNIHIPPITRFHPSADNPLLAPCKCTGSMAFVHYLCVEQWRCRSRHPGAKNGLNCETCGSEYTLPPPPSRPTNNRNNPAGVGVEGGMMMVGDDDWLDAMPPHVLAALRRPHPWWQLGAAVVRRRWLRPIVPVLASPIVALYCKARRTLKKRGVSRRRWACSLCRRRARWKCVRCLRSYYCSRQCQNVSWHIVHKHVCYKPARFWSSVVVYTLGTLMFVPGIIKNFPIYDTSATLLPINFVAMGNIAGGVASTLKRSAGIDIRGRTLEVSVIICTFFLTAVTTGLVRGYFGDSSQCFGVLASSTPFTESTTEGPFIDSFSNKAFAALLEYAKLYYNKWDFLGARASFMSRNFLCTPTEDGNTDYATIGCSPPVRSINPQFYLEEENCEADIGMIVGIWVAACLVLCLEHIYRKYRVRRRAAVQRGRRRPHQD